MIVMSHSWWTTTDRERRRKEWIVGMSDALDHRTGPYAALLLRVTLGVLFVAHLYWKFAVFDGGFARVSWSRIRPRVNSNVTEAKTGERA